MQREDEDQHVRDEEPDDAAGEFDPLHQPVVAGPESQPFIDRVDHPFQPDEQPVERIHDQPHDPGEDVILMSCQARVMKSTLRSGNVTADGRIQKQRRDEIDVKHRAGTQGQSDQPRREGHQPRERGGFQSFRRSTANDRLARNVHKL